MFYNIEELYKDLKKNYKAVECSWLVKSNPNLLTGVDDNFHTFEVLVKNNNKLATLQKQQLIQDMNKTNDYLKDIRKKSNI